MFVRNGTVGICLGGRIALDRAWHNKQVYIEENKLFYITKGELVLRVNGEEVVCGAGDMVLVPAKLCHDYYLSPLEKCHKYWLHFTMNAGGTEPLTGMVAPLRISVPEEDRRMVEDRFFCLTKEGEGLAVECKKLGILYELVAYFLEKASAVWTDRPRGEFDAVMAYIDQNLTDDLSLKALAKRVCLSPGYFARRFKTVVGLSPSKYVSMARLEKAKAALSKSDGSVYEVMREVGFTDAAYFSKSFKLYTGYSPVVYRRLSK